MAKDEKKDEMKNRISLALKDPVLQQGFEIICKENAELKARLNAVNLLTPELEKSSRLKKRQLTRAEELLKKWVFFHGGTKEFKSPLQEETEVFLKEL